MKLFETLTGDAREMTASLFASGTGAYEIIRSLEMRYDNDQVILERIINNIKELPTVESSKLILSFLQNFKMLCLLSFKKCRLFT